ncbi:MAG: AAA family ATPase [Methanobacteriota archaeon]|nr:MAG: AAA family ATPase [Euryarchaeota archaeon]
MRIAVSGPPGSGKTTVSEIVANRLGYKLVLVGQVFRQMAEERKVSLDTFGRYAEEDETIDKELDSRMIAIARGEDDIVIEGRLAGALMRRGDIEAFTVNVDAAEDVRCLRIAKRENKPVDQVQREIRVRERSENKRYIAYYGIDVSNKMIYDLWIDSSGRSAEEVADAIVDEVRKRLDDEGPEGEGQA